MPPAIALTNELDVAALQTEFADVVEMTREIFGGDVRIEVDPDPEIVGLTNIVFCVTTIGGPREIADRSEQWHVRLDAICETHDRRLGLFVEPRE